MRGLVVGPRAPLPSNCLRRELLFVVVPENNRFAKIRSIKMEPLEQISHLLVSGLALDSIRYPRSEVCGTEMPLAMRVRPTPWRNG